jgi:hypothetical protein
MDEPPNRRCDRARIACRPDREIDNAHREIFRGNVDRAGRRSMEAGVAHVADDADHEHAVGQPGRLC